MLLNIYLIVLFICFCIGLGSVYYNRNVPLRLKVFPWFIFLTFVVELIAKWSTIPQQAVIYNVFTVFEFVFLFYMLYGFLAHKWIKRSLFYVNFVYPIGALINVFFIHGVYQFHTNTFLIGSVLLIFFSSYYLYELFFKKKNMKPFEHPYFWVALGILLFYSCTASMVLTFDSWQLFSPADRKLVNSILLYINMVYYSLFAIAFLCIPKQKKHQ